MKVYFIFDFQNKRTWNTRYDNWYVFVEANYEI